MTNPAGLVDTNLYPIFDKASVDFFEDCKATYQSSGVLALSGFILPDALDLMAKQARDVEHLSYKKIKHHNAFLLDIDTEFDQQHPRNRQLVTTNSTIADADIQSDSALRALYLCKELHIFIAYVIGKASVYPYEDTLSPLNIGVSRTGETLAWHFDTSDFATTLLLQASNDGGAFEYIPHTRSENNPGYEKVAKLLDGDQQGVEVLDAGPGTLVLFQGRHSIHRVSPVIGTKTRLVAILTYDEKPGQRMNAFTQKKFYGRAA